MTSNKPASSSEPAASPASPKPHPQQAPLLHRLQVLFWVFLGISAVSLGGGLAMLPIMSREFVAKRQWLTNDDMIDTIALMQSLPGIIATNMAVLIGYRVAGIPGALAGSAGVALPPALAQALGRADAALAAPSTMRSISAMSSSENSVLVREYQPLLTWAMPSTCRLTALPRAWKSVALPWR